MKLKFQFLFFIFLSQIIFNSCNYFEKRNEYKIYTISSGKQSSTEKVSFYSKDEMNFLAKFDETAIYRNKDTLNQWDLNKLYGFSDCSSAHHINSARFGWHWFNNQLEIHAYCYVNSVRYSQFISIVNLNEEYRYSIKVAGNQYLFSLNGITVSMPRGCSNNGAKYRLYPYFGGDETAPHDIHIRIKEL